MFFNTKHLRLTVLAGLFAMGSGGAFAATNYEFSALPVLGDPGVTQQLYLDATGTPRQALMMNGIPIAFLYDDFWSYSNPVLLSLQNDGFLDPTIYGSYDGSTGTGTIPILLASPAGSHENANDTQSSVVTNGSNTIIGYSATWGNTQQVYIEQSDPAGPAVIGTNAVMVVSDPKYDGTTTVGEMLEFMQSLDPDNTVPVLYADYRQTGANDSLYFSAYIEIIRDEQSVAHWSLDALSNGNPDPLSPTFNYGEISFYGSNDYVDPSAECLADAFSMATGSGCAGVTTNGSSYEDLNHNKGQGQPDFIAFAPTMDLSKFLVTDLFVVTAKVGCYDGVMPQSGFGVDDSGVIVSGCNTANLEEFGIFGAVGSLKVPEPGSIALLGLGMIGLFLRRRREL